MSTTTQTIWQRIASQGVAAMAAELSTQQAIDMAEQYGTHNYKPLPVNIVRGKGAKVWDSDGTEYFDCIGAYSAVAHGHLNETVLKTMEEQLRRVSLTSRAFYVPELALFSKLLAEYADLDMICAMNTGAEAIETCIKLARKWAYTVKGVPKDKAEIIVCTDNFHGRTTTIVGFSTEEQYKEGFGPFTPGFKVIPFGDIEALKAAITPNTAALLAEPCQAEGGVLFPPEGFLAEARKVLTENNCLLIWDEVQTGFCRTGKRFAWQYEDAKPDLMAVGKPLGGGIYPVSAAIGRREVMEVFQPGDHGSTFGGNPLACSIALAALAEMEVEDYCGRATRLGERLMNHLKAIQSPHILEIRGRGLLIGLEVKESCDSKALSKALTANGILTKETRNHTFRFTPPIVISEQEIDEVAARTAKALASI